MISGRCLISSSSSMYFQVRSSEVCRNSEKVTGRIVRMVTFPTGTCIFFFFTATPSSEPAATTWYSGAFSQKYLRLFRAASQACISSSTISVRPASSGTSVYSASSLSRRSTSRVRSKTPQSSCVSSKSNFAVNSKLSLPKRSIAQVFPICRAPLSSSGFLSGESFQAFSSSSIVL